VTKEAAAWLREKPVQSIDLVRDNLNKSRDRVLARIEDMREHAVVFPTPTGGNHTLWVLGHLAFVESLVVHAFMLGSGNGFGRTEPTRSPARASRATWRAWPR
jgi:hypothetical protein